MYLLCVSCLPLWFWCEACTFILVIHDSPLFIHLLKQNDFMESSLPKIISLNLWYSPCNFNNWQLSQLGRSWVTCNVEVCIFTFGMWTFDCYTWSSLIPFSPWWLVWLIIRLHIPWCCCLWWMLIHLFKNSFLLFTWCCDELISLVALNFKTELLFCKIQTMPSQ